MINSFKNFIELALNKNQMGKPSPSEFNNALAEAELKNYTELFSDFRKLTYKKGRFGDTAHYGSEAEYLKQALEYYITTANITTNDAGVMKMPEDLHLIDTLFSDITEVEKVDLQIFNRLKRQQKNTPTACSPIYTYNDGVLMVFPAHSQLEVSYFRKLRLPKWTYRIVGGVEVFDKSQSDFQDIDMHPLLYHKLFVDTLGLLGLNIKEEYAMQYVAQMKQEEQIAQQ